MKTLLLGALAALIAGPAAAEVKSATPQGFELVETITVHVPPETAYAALSTPARWWNGEHSFSGDAKNFSLGLKPGGCFCERLKDGGWAKHLEVTMVQPGESIELHGGLGPLRSEGVAGVLRWTVKPAEGGGATITQSYVVGGYMRQGGEHWAPARRWPCCRTDDAAGQPARYRGAGAEAAGLNSLRRGQYELP
ncbi:MAG: SRPBCC family protein [Aliidongia sp.]